MLPIPIIFFSHVVCLNGEQINQLSVVSFTWCLKKGHSGGKNAATAVTVFIIALLLFVGIPIPEQEPGQKY